MKTFFGLDISETTKTRVVLGTLCGTLFCVLASILGDSVNFADMSDDHFRRSLATDILIPLCVGGPFFYILLEKIRQLAIARVALQELASTDSLTAVLNRGAFTMLVEAYLDKAETRTRLQEGSLLIVDADHFKKINDTHGHQTGDRALKMIAGVIQGALKNVDIVGRIGGEEFCVFLPKALEDEARQIAETIRKRIHDLPFPSDGIQGGLSVSVGGVSFSQGVTYKELFTVADQRLYQAKASGRNAVVFGSLAEHA